MTMLETTEGCGISGEPWPSAEEAGIASTETQAPLSSSRWTPSSRVLVVDDSRVARRYLEKVLLESGLCTEVFLAESGLKGLDIFRENAVDLVLCDVRMPGLSGFEFLTQMRSNLATREVPVIMLTAEQDFQSKLECLQSGASDYLLKPFAKEELVARARIHLQLKGLQDELKSKNVQLAALARLDPLTGIPNRHDFFECAERELERAQREARPIALAMIDIDHFKQVNDNFGHLCGDRALIKAAGLLKRSLRTYDLLGRYGGEEFIAVFVGAGAAEATLVAERCRRRVAETPLAIKGQKLKITISIGLSLATEAGPGMLTEMIAKADEALYLAKDRGRDQVVLDPIELTCAGDPRESRAG